MRNAGGRTERDRTTPSEKRSRVGSKSLRRGIPRRNIRGALIAFMTAGVIAASLPSPAIAGYLSNTNAYYFEKTGSDPAIQQSVSNSSNNINQEATITRVGEHVIDYDVTASAGGLHLY